MTIIVQGDEVEDEVEEETQEVVVLIEILAVVDIEEIALEALAKEEAEIILLIEETLQRETIEDNYAHRRYI